MLGVYKDDLGHFHHYMMHVLFCISWHAMTPVIFSLKLNLNITQLEDIVDWVMVPLNRDFPVQPHLPLWEGLDSVH